MWFESYTVGPQVYQVTVRFTLGTNKSIRSLRLLWTWSFGKSLLFSGGYHLALPSFWTGLQLRPDGQDGTMTDFLSNWLVSDTGWQDGNGMLEDFRKNKIEFSWTEILFKLIQEAVGCELRPNYHKTKGLRSWIEGMCNSIECWVQKTMGVCFS